MPSVIQTRLLLTGALCLPLLLAAPAHAQERDPAAAQALFDQARQLSQQGRFAEACPKFQESNRLDPAAGTQFNLADCYDRAGRTASAWAAFLEAASQMRAVGQRDREKAAQQRAEQLEPRLPRLIVLVPDENQLPGLEVRRNGVSVGTAQWGTPVPVDPGEIELEASAPGKLTAKQALRLEEGKTVTYNVPALAVDPSVAVAATSQAKPEPEPEPEPAKPEPAQAKPADKGSNAPWIITLGAAGIIGLGVGTTFAILADQQYDDSLQDCDIDDPNMCGVDGYNQRNDARTKGTVATVGFVAGGALLATAAIVWIASGSSKSKQASAQHPRVSAAPVLGPGHAGLAMQGSF